MSYEGFLSFGGAEIMNAGRTATYVNNLLPQFGLAGCAECDDLRHALGHEPYTSPFVDHPDWFDENNPDSWRFYGLYPVEINGLDDSVRESAVTQLAVDGAVMSAPRQQGREIRVSALLIGADDAAVQYGITWLRYATFGAACREGEGCTGDHLCYFAACPPICEDSPDVTHSVEPRIHNFRTCDEGIITNYERACALPYERNLYQVTVVDGPRVVEQYDTVCGSMIRVEFTMVAGVPWAYSTATWVDDSQTGDPSTIIPDITCEAGTTAVVRRNLATNPIPTGVPGTAGWASADPAIWSVAQDTDVIRLPGDASARMEVLDNSAQPNLATNPGPTANLTGWTYHLGEGPNEQSRENLFDNPRLVDTAGWTHTGLPNPASSVNQWANNPGLEVDCTGWDASGFGAVPGPASVTNVVVDPRATGGNTWSQTLRWFGGGGGAGTRSLVTEVVGPAGLGISTAARKTWTTAPTGNADTGFQIVASSAVQRFTVTPGSTYYAGGYLRTTATGQKTGVARIVFYDAAEAATGGMSVPATGGALAPFTAADGWIFVEHSRVAPADAATAMVIVDTTSGTGDVVWAVGDQLDGTGAIFADQGATGWTGYFDGGTAPTPEWAFGWVGLENNGPSGAYPAATGVVTCHPYGPDSPQNTVANTTTWGQAGYVEKVWDTAAYGANIAGSAAFIGPVPLSDLTGPSALQYAFEISVWAAPTLQVRTVAQFLDANGAVVFTSAGVAQFATGSWLTTYQNVTRSAVPATATQVRLSVSPVGNVPVGQVLRLTQARAGHLQASNGALPWFDGDTPEYGGTTIVWDGEPYASTSTMTAVGSAAYVLTAETGAGPGGLPGFLRRTTTVPATRPAQAMTYTSPRAATWTVTAGEPFTATVRVRPSIAQRVTRVQAGLIGPSNVGWYITDTTVRELPADQWSTITITGTAASDTAAARPYLRFELDPTAGRDEVGMTFDVAQVLFQRGTSAGPYFDGDFTDSGAITYAWTGTANASTSTLTVTQPSTTSTLQTGGGGPAGQTTFMRNVIVVPKTDGFSGPSYTQAVTVPVGGAQFTTSIWVRSTVGGSAPLRVQALNADGAVLASVISAPVIVVPDTWTLFGPVTIDAPLGTTAIRVWPQTDGTQILPAGTAVDVGHVTLVQGWSLYSTIMAHLTFAGQHTLTRVIALMPTVQYTASLYVATSRPAYARVDVVFYNTSGGIIGRAAGPAEHVAGTFQPTPARMWTRIEHTFVAPAGTATATFESVVTRDPDGYAEVGDRTWFTNMLVERSSVPMAYFDGSFADTPTLNYGWTGTAGASISTASQVIPVVPGPVLDPDCAVVPSAPRPPALEIACLDTPAAWRRYTALIPDDVVPVWRDAVPIVDIQTQATAARQVRVRFYPNPFANPMETLDPCDFCGEFVISYIPPNSVLTIDGIRQQAFVTGPTGAVQVANHLLYSSDGGPMQWPLLSCGVTYTTVLDVAPEGVEDLSAKLCIAARE